MIDMYNACKIFVNGDLVSIHHKPNELIEKLRLYRRHGKINIYISMAWNIEENNITIYSDGCRPCRPLLIVKDNKLVIIK